MEKHVVRVILSLEVDAFGKSDALEAVEDVFGEGECGGGVCVTDLEIIDYAKLS